MDINIIIGITASALTAISSTPQLIKIIREKTAENISVVMYGVLISGLACWIYYGYLKDDPIIIISNSVALIINLAVFTLSVIFKKNS